MARCGTLHVALKKFLESRGETVFGASFVSLIRPLVCLPACPGEITGGRKKKSTIVVRMRYPQIVPFDQLPRIPIRKHTMAWLSPFPIGYTHGIKPLHQGRPRPSIPIILSFAKTGASVPLFSPPFSCITTEPPPPKLSSSSIKESFAAQT